MFNKFHRWGLFCHGCAVAVVCLLFCNTAVGDVICDEDDEDIGVCLYEGWFLISENSPTIVEDISCEWVLREGVRRFECEPIDYTINLVNSYFWPYTFMVYAETDLDRVERIALTVDNWIVETVTRWEEECNRYIYMGEPAVRGNDGKKLTPDECLVIIMVYDAGLQNV